MVGVNVYSFDSENPTTVNDLDECVVVPSVLVPVRFPELQFPTRRGRVGQRVWVVSPSGTSQVVEEALVTVGGVLSETSSLTLRLRSPGDSWGVLPFPGGRRVDTETGSRPHPGYPGQRRYHSETVLGTHG